MKLSSVFALAILLVGCGKSQPPVAQALRINIAAEPKTLDPRKARDLTDVTMCRMLFEGLTRIGRDGSPELAIAEAVEITPDGLEYVFHLRDALWSDGSPVTSYDFATSWKTILNKDFPTDIAYQLYLIQNGKRVKSGEADSNLLGVDTPDAHTLIVRLEQPTPYFLEVCAMTSYLPVPEKVSEQNPKWTQEAATFVGNGPFVIEAWTHNNQVLVAKNEKYWEASTVKLGKMELMMVAPDTEIRMYEEGELDWAGSPISTLPIDAIKHLKQENLLKVSPLSGTYFFRVNTSEAIGDSQNPLSSDKCRRALAIAVDREAIALHLLQGGQAAARSLVPPEMKLTDKAYFSEGDARPLMEMGLEELGLNRDSLKPIVISFVASDRNMSIAQAIQRKWEETFALPFVLEAVESKVFYQRIREKNFQLAAGSWIADFNDPINYLEVFKYKSGSTNNTNWENPKYIDLLDQSTVCGDQVERKRLLREAEEILMEQMPIIPIFHFAMNFMQQEGVKDVALSPIGQIDFRWAQIEPSLPMR